MIQKRLPIQEFADEIAEDLPTLLEQNPGGIYFSELMSFYGETITRVTKAVSILETKGDITLHAAASRAQFIVPKGVGLTILFPELSVLQRRVAIYARTLASQKQVTKVETDYSQLCRIMHCSYGGLRACIKRLQELGYLNIEEQSQRGKQGCLVLSLHQKLLSPYR
jgi:hypothetical protein